MPLVSRVFAFIWDLEIVCLSRIEDVTHILDALRSGDPKAANDLRPLIYQELRRLAAVKMAGEHGGADLSGLEEAVAQGGEVEVHQAGATVDLQGLLHPGAGEHAVGPQNPVSYQSVNPSRPDPRQNPVSYQ